MSNVYKLSDYRNTDLEQYIQSVQNMSIPDLLLEITTYTEQWQNTENLSTNFKKRGMILFTEAYHTCQTPEMRNIALEAISRLEDIK